VFKVSLARAAKLAVEPLWDVYNERGAGEGRGRETHFRTTPSKGASNNVKGGCVETAASCCQGREQRRGRGLGWVEGKSMREGVRRLLWEGDVG
jgi:hypothetical protein